MNILHCLNQTCTIQERTVAENASSGQAIPTWTNIAITQTLEPLGLGTGVLAVFQTARKAVTAVSSVFVAGVLQTVAVDYTVAGTGDPLTVATITFIAGHIPALDAEVTVTYTHKDSNCERCRLDMSRGGEKRLPKKIYERVTHLLFMAYRTDLDYKEKRIVVGTQTFNILLVTPAGGITSHVELELELVD